MELIIQKYLSQYYYIKTSDVGNDGIYYKFEKRRIPPPINSSKLINEISVVFSINEKDAKDFIINWSILVKNGVDLVFYWRTIESFIS